MTDDRPRCQDVHGTRWDPNGRYECANRARYVTAGGKLLCGRHLRYAGPVTEIPR